MQNLNWFFVLVTVTFPMTAAHGQTLPGDGYHIEPVTLCSPGESCLINQRDGSVIRWADRGLTQISNLSDSVYAQSQHCYQGDPKEVCSILEEMARIEGIDYYQGGHQLITRFSCRSDSKILSTIQLEFDVRYDMGLPQKETIQKLISLCK